MRVQSSDVVRALVGAVEAVLTDLSSPSQVRAAWTDPSAARQKLWPELCRMGLPGLTRDEERGGGLPFDDLMPVLEVAGRHAVTVPLAESVGAACPVLADERGDDAARLLDELDDGRALVTVQDGWSGWAPWAALASHVLVLDDDQVAVCEVATGEVQKSAAQDASRHLGRAVPSSRSWTLSQPGAAHRLRAYATVSTVATMNGLAGGALDQAVDYAKVRRQFGAPIGSFQAIRHRLAAAFARLEFTRRYAYYAAWAVANDAADADRAVRRAKAVAGDVAVEVSYAAMQAFGGVGYTWECDLHLWMKRIQALDGAYGTSDVHWQALAAAAKDREVLP